MVHAVLTLWGMVEYKPSILENLALPDGMDAAILKDYIYMYCGDNECRYGNPDILDRLVHSWFTARKEDYSRMWEALHAEYNPIENYDRTEEFTETNRGDVDTTHHTESSGHADNTLTPGKIMTETSSAFDSSDYQPRYRNEESGTEKNEANNTGNVDGTQNVNTDMTRTNTGRVHGNIGVTTNQQMIEAELELRRNDIYKMMALAFEDEFTVPVYSRRCNYGMLL